MGLQEGAAPAVVQGERVGLEGREHRGCMWILRVRKQRIGQRVSERAAFVGTVMNVNVVLLERYTGEPADDE